jgi:hypothetical protein
LLLNHCACAYRSLGEQEENFEKLEKAYSLYFHALEILASRYNNPEHVSERDRQNKLMIMADMALLCVSLNKLEEALSRASAVSHADHTCFRKNDVRTAFLGDLEELVIYRVQLERAKRSRATLSEPVAVGFFTLVPISVTTRTPQPPIHDMPHEANQTGHSEGIEHRGVKRAADQDDIDQDNIGKRSKTP